jgi:hypothetical protein
MRHLNKLGYLHEQHGRQDRSWWSGIRGIHRRSPFLSLEISKRRRRLRRRVRISTSPSLGHRASFRMHLSRRLIGGRACSATATFRFLAASSLHYLRLGVTLRGPCTAVRFLLSGLSFRLVLLLRRRQHSVAVLRSRGVLWPRSTRPSRRSLPFSRGTVRPLLAEQ